MCLLCVFAVSAAFSQAASKTDAPRKMTDAQIIEDLRSHLDRALAEGRLSGAVLVAKNGKILFEQAYGFADHAFNVPNKVDTKFNLGSMGKMFTGVSVLQLVQEGKMSLDDKLIKDLPDYPNKDIAEKITIYQLLTHTSGLGDFFGPEFAANSMAKFRTLESLLPLFVNKPLLFDPGTKWQYSNAGFIVLGLVIEHVSGESYYDYVRENVFKPAGMINTDNYNIDADVPNLALGYTSVGDNMRPLPDGQRRSNIFILQRGGSAGGGYSTVEDLLRFSEALQGHKLLDKEYTHMDMTGKVATGRGDAKYGFGMEEQFINGVRIVGHSGGGPGISSNLDMYPDLGYAVAVTSNYDNGMQPIIERLRKELTGQELPKAIHLSSDILKSFVGKYEVTSSPDGPPGRHLPPMAITADQEGLWLDVGMGGRHRCLPLSPVEFFIEDSPDAQLTFTKDEKGQVTGLTAISVAPFPLKATKLP